MQLCMFERNIRKCTDSEKFVQDALVVRSEKQIRKSGIKFKKDDSCNYCKKKGHWVINCRKWKADGRPSRNSKTGDAQSNAVDTEVAVVSICDEINEVESNSPDWLVDNGATRHVTNCPEFFIDFKEFENPCSIKSAGEEKLQAVGKGTIKVLSSVDHKTVKMTLKDVWYVPKISRNLFSVLAAQDRNPDSKFRSTPTRCVLEINGKAVFCGVRQLYGTLYKAAIKMILPEGKTQINVALTDSTKLQIYHERWGHQDKRHVKDKLQKELGIKVKLNNEVCEPCIYGKAHRLPFGTRIKATKPGELMSTDICGPFDESFSKKKYLVVFKDSYTKFRYGFPVQKKSDVKDVLKQVLAQSKTLGHSIKELLSDNGGEFDNDEVRNILKENGTTQRLTAPYTPEQNGGAERENRTIVEMARTFKYSNPDNQFPEAIWAELVNTAVYVLNRTGKSSEKGVSPYELWIGKKPRIKHLRIIGSTCYIHIPVQKRRKMDEKAVKGYLVGYDGEERYRIYIKEDKKVVLSRDVQFQENIKNCEEKVKLPLQDTDIDTEDQLDSKQEETESNSEKYESEDDTDFEEEQKDSQNSTERSLRDRSALKKPMRFESYIMEAESFINSVEDPETLKEAMESKQKAEWKNAMDNEMASLKENQTWKLTNLPRGAKAIPSKWVFRLKTNPDGTVDRYKARLVIKGFSQRPGIDYSQTFSPVARLGTIRSILSIAASEGMHLKQFDVSTAFLYGELDEQIFMEQPEGYEDGTRRVCELKKSLYGLKQAPRCWNRRFGSFLLGLGFRVSEADPCLYIREENGKKVLVVLYVDDGLIAATDSDDLDIFLDELRSEFKIVSKTADYFLGLEIEQRTKLIKINQKAHAKKILERFNFSNCRAVSTPMLKNPETSKTGKGDDQNHKFPYRQAVGALMYLMLGTRPDLAYSVGFLSRSLENPTTEDVARVKRVFRYIAGTEDLGIVYHRDIKRGILECFSDADFGGCSKTGRSTSGVVVLYAGGAISWLSQRQAMVATSTTEAEIIAANEAAKEVIWLTRLFREVIKIKQVPVLQVDNSAAVRLAQNPEFHRRTKHISMKHFFVREKVTEGRLEIEQVSTDKQLADVMTKPLPQTRLKILCEQLGVL